MPDLFEYRRPVRNGRHGRMLSTLRLRHPVSSTGSDLRSFHRSRGAGADPVRVFERRLHAEEHGSAEPRHPCLQAMSGSFQRLRCRRRLRSGRLVLTRGSGQVHKPSCLLHRQHRLLDLGPPSWPRPQAHSDAPQPAAGLALGVGHGSYRDATVNRHDVDDRVRKSRQQAPSARVVAGRRR